MYTLTEFSHDCSLKMIENAISAMLENNRDIEQIKIYRHRTLGATEELVEQVLSRQVIATIQATRDWKFATQVHRRSLDVPTYEITVRVCILAKDKNNQFHIVSSNMYIPNLQTEPKDLSELLMPIDIQCSINRDQIEARFKEALRGSPTLCNTQLNENDDFI